MSVSVLRNNRQQRCAANSLASCGEKNGTADAKSTSPQSSSPTATVEAVTVVSCEENSEKVFSGNKNKNDCEAEIQQVDRNPNVITNFKKTSTASSNLKKHSSGSRHPRRRGYSCSEDDAGESGTNSFPSGIPKRARRCENDSEGCKMDNKEKLNDFSDHHHRADSRQKSAGVPLIHQPRAPKNTTQFLITDREERESSDREFVASTSSANAVADTIGEADCSSEMLPVVTTTTMAVTKEANNHPLGRSRCNTAPSNPRSSSGNSDVNDMEEDIEDPEFAAMYDDYNFERIKNLSREEVNREMLETQKSNLHLTEKVGLLKAENQRLHALLNTYGVMDTSAPPNGTSFPSALRKSTSPYTKAANEKRET